MLISYNDASLHDFLVAEGHITANDTGPITYPRVAETVTVTSFKKYNHTAVDIGVVSTKPGQTRVVRILNGAAYLLTEHADGSTTRADLCAGTVSCAAFTVGVDLGAALKEQAIGNLSAVGVVMSEDDQATLNGHTASVGRRLRHHGRETSVAEQRIAVINPDGTFCWVCDETATLWRNNAVCPDVDFPYKHEGKFACYNEVGKGQYDQWGWGMCDTWCEMFPGAGERGGCTSFAGGASDPPVCANDLCRDKAYPFKHADVDVCYNANGYEDYLTKGWSSCGTWCENTKGAGAGCPNPPACNKCSDNPTYKHYHDWNLHTWKQALQVCYNDEGWSQLNSRGYGDCGTLCALPGTCPGGSCHGCTGVQECAAVYFAASSTAPPSGGRRLFEPDKPHELSGCEDAADEFVKQLSEEALGRTLSSCAEVKIVGGCEHEAAKMHCPQTCGLCDALGAQEDKMNRRQMVGKCANENG